MESKTIAKNLVYQRKSKGYTQEATIGKNGGNRPHHTAYRKGRGKPTPSDHKTIGRRIGN